MQHRFARFISKVHVKHTHVACKARIGYRPVAVRMFPCPHICTLFAFFKDAVSRFARVYKRDIAVVRFRLFIEQLTFAAQPKLRIAVPASASPMRPPVVP